jgi:hypothetical protein
MTRLSWNKSALDTQAYGLEEVTNPRRLQLEECTAPIFEM